MHDHRRVVTDFELCRSSVGVARTWGWGSIPIYKGLFRIYVRVGRRILRQGVENFCHNGWRGGEAIHFFRHMRHFSRGHRKFTHILLGIL